MPRRRYNVRFDGNRWRARAEQVRTVGESLADPDCRRMMLQAAAGYERLAMWADERASAPMTSAARRSRRRSAKTEGTVFSHSAAKTRPPDFTS